MKMFKKKGNNKGFSLIEVLMAVVLLGLIATPILQMFYTSFQMNLRSKKYLAAADLANAMAEAISAQTYEDSKTTSNVTGPGLKSYYQGPLVGVDRLYKTTSTSGVITEGPAVLMSSGGSGTLYFKSNTGAGIPYGGFKFYVSLEFVEKGSEDFHAVDCIIRVYDASTSAVAFGEGSYTMFAELSNVTVTVPNKRY